MLIYIYIYILNTLYYRPFIIDVDIRVLRDYGITSGTTNENSWARRELHVGQDGAQIRLTLWNDQVILYKNLFCLNFCSIRPKR